MLTNKTKAELALCWLFQNASPHTLTLQEKNNMIISFFNPFSDGVYEGRPIYEEIPITTIILDQMELIGYFDIFLTNWKKK